MGAEIVQDGEKVVVPWSLVFTKSSGCRHSVETIPAVKPATVSTKDDDKPFWPVMNLSLKCGGCKIEGEMRKEGWRERERDGSKGAREEKIYSSDLLFAGSGTARGAGLTSS